MSRPAARWARRRTTGCPTCLAPRGRPCVRLPGNDTADATTDRGPHVTPHADRLRAEAALLAGHEHHWAPVPAYRRSWRDESNRCVSRSAGVARCGAVEVRGVIYG